MSLGMAILDFAALMALVIAAKRNNSTKTIARTSPARTSPRPPLVTHPDSTPVVCCEGVETVKGLGVAEAAAIGKPDTLGVCLPAERPRLRPFWLKNGEPDPGLLAYRHQAS